MNEPLPIDPLLSDDEQTLVRMGYQQELHRTLGAFSNFAISLSIICILAGGVTSFHIGLCSVGGAAIGIGWPLCCLFSLIVSLTMGQVASAFPTAGGLYHWAAILGGKGWGYVTAWFNLVGLVTVLAAINVGAYEFAISALIKPLLFDPETFGGNAFFLQLGVVSLITFTQAMINHRGIRLTAKLTDFSGYLILVTSVILTLSMLGCASTWDFSRLIRFENFSGLPESKTVWPSNSSLFGLFFLGLLLPAYTITGFDASAHAAEETVQASMRVPLGMVRSVLVSGVFGWLMLCSMIVTAPDLKEAAMQGGDAFVWIMRSVLPAAVFWPLLLCIILAQYLCGLATVTSASRMMYAFARDGGVPLSDEIRKVNPTFRTPISAIWLVAGLAVGFTIYTPVYSTITAVCVLMLYVSYVLPTWLGFLAYGRTWTTMGPWNLGVWYRPLALIAVVGCVGLFFIGIHPPNEQALPTLGVFVAVLGFAVSSWNFRGPPKE